MSMLEFLMTAQGAAVIAGFAILIFLPFDDDMEDGSK